MKKIKEFFSVISHFIIVRKMKERMGKKNVLVLWFVLGVLVGWTIAYVIRK